MMRSWLILLLTLFALWRIAGCTNSPPPRSASTQPTTQPTTSTPERVAWHMPGMFVRFRANVTLATPATMRVPVTIDEPDVPHDLMRYATFSVIEIDAD